jgi:hypothetical protein
MSLTSPKSRLALARATSGSQSSALTNGTAMMEGGEVREGEREGERDSARCVGGREKKTRLCKQANRKKQKILDLGP